MSCGACGRVWPGVETGRRAGGRHVVAACRRCGEVKGVRLPRPKKELRAYLHDLIQVREKLLQSYEKGRARLAGMGAGERLSRLRRPETKGLDEAIERARKDLGSAPEETEPRRCEACGDELVVYEEQTSGYHVPCPACGQTLSFRFVPPPDGTADERPSTPRRSRDPRGR